MTLHLFHQCPSTSRMPALSFIPTLAKGSPTIHSDGGHNFIYCQYKFNKKRMNIDLGGVRVAGEIEQQLMRRINSFIQKRDALLANMNMYSLIRLSHMIEEINEQLVITVSNSSIQDIEDLISIPTDNFMSVADGKSLLQESPKPQLIIDDNVSKHSSIKEETERRKRRYSMYKRQASSLETEDKRSKTIVPTNSYVQHCVPLTAREEEVETRQVQMMRLTKIHEEQELAIKRAKQNLAREKKVVIDLNGKRIMFDYDSKITKLEDIKPKQPAKIRNVNTSVQIEDYDYANNQKKLDELNKRNVRDIRQKVNITKKDMEEEKRRKGRGSFIPSKLKNAGAAEEPVEVISSVIQINPESHKEIEEAIRVIENGIKITVNRNDYSKPKNTPRKITNLIKKMTRSEYINFKAEEARRGLILKRDNTHRMAISEVKIASPEAKKSEITNTPSTVTHLQLQSNVRKVSFALERKVKSNDSRISIFNEQMRRDLVNQVDKKVRFDDPPKESPAKVPLTNVEKYNLLYTKYQGFPPDEVVKELQNESKIVQRFTERRLTQIASKKQNWVRENRHFLQKAR